VARVQRPTRAAIEEQARRYSPPHDGAGGRLLSVDRQLEMGCRFVLMRTQDAARSEGAFQLFDSAYCYRLVYESPSYKLAWAAQVVFSLAYP
jgi:hypothetical protein